MEMVCILSANGKAIELHRFSFPPITGRGRYRAITSYSWFLHREAKRYTALYEANKEPAKHAYAMRWDDLYKSAYEELPVIVHQTIWDMYKAIGYDYKRQKFT